MDVPLILKNARTLNAFLVTAGEADCAELLQAELAGKNRLILVLRIHSRLNRVRAAREREELRKGSKGGV